MSLFKDSIYSSIIRTKLDSPVIYYNDKYVGPFCKISSIMPGNIQTIRDFLKSNQDIYSWKEEVEVGTKFIIRGIS